MPIWRAYSPEFQDAYNRRFKDKVENEKSFDIWVKKYDEWLNKERVKDGNLSISPSIAQIKALAVEARYNGMKETAVRVKIKASRTKKEYRYIYRDILTGGFAHNPNKVKK